MSRLTLLTLYLLASLSPSHAAERDASSRQISLQSLLQHIHKTHPLIQRERLGVEIQERNYAALGADQDWVLQSQPGFRYEEPIPLSPFQANSQQNTSVDLSLGRSIWNTGGRFATSWSYTQTNRDIDDIVIPGGGNSIDTGPTDLHEQRLFASYTHPLLKNKGGAQDSLAWQLQELKVAISRLQSDEGQESLLENIALRFLDWTLLTEQRRIAIERLDLATKQLAHQKKKQTLNLIEQVDVMRAEGSVLASELTLALIRNGWSATQRELATLAGDPSILNKAPVHDLYTYPDIPKLGNQSTLPHSRILQTHDLTEQQLARQLYSAENRTHPQLDIDFQGGIRSGTEAFSDSTQLELPEAALLLTFRYPLGNRKAAENLERTKIEIRHASASRDETTRKLSASIQGLAIRLEGMKPILALNVRQIALAKKQTTEEQRLHEQGRNDLLFVIQSEDQLRNSQLVHAQNATRYHQLHIQLLALVDELLDSVATP